MSDTFLPLRFILTVEARHDVQKAAGYSPVYIIADAAYDWDALRTEIHAQDAIAVIRLHRNRFEDRPCD